MRLIYRPLGMLISVLGGVLASFVFKRMWKLVAPGEDAPQATEEHRSWGDVLTAATLQGAVFGLVKAVLDRGGAAGFSRLTGEWPGKK